MSLTSMISRRPGASGFGRASTAAEVTAGLDLRGKNVLITGIASGLGAESARILAKRGARIFGAARSHAKAEAACRILGEDAVALACDLADPASVRACVAAVKAMGPTLDVILCNAAVMALPEREVRSGQELQFLTNHLGHFVLVTELLPHLAPDGRVVMVSSAAHTMAPREGIRLDDLSFARGYTPWTAYGQSKLANLLFTRALARRFRGSRRTANAVHPGMIRTNLGRHMNPWVRRCFQVVTAGAMKSIPEGAATQCYVATHPALAGVSGAYFVDCDRAMPSRQGRDDALAERLWVASEAIVAGL